MVAIVDIIVDGMTSSPVATAFSVLLLLFIFGGYLLLRRSVSEFRQGFEGE
jgi:hypothetical protein